MSRETLDECRKVEISSLLFCDKHLFCKPLALNKRVRDRKLMSVKNEKIKVEVICHKWKKKSCVEDLANSIWRGILWKKKEKFDHWTILLYCKRNIKRNSRSYTIKREIL